MSTSPESGQPSLPEPIRPLDPERVQQIADMLDGSPRGIGRPIGDRNAWEPLGHMDTFRKVLSEAEALREEPTPELTEDIYLDHVRTGSEEVYNEYSSTTRARFAKLVLAECLEDERRFLPAIHDAIRAACEEPTWVHAFHDPQLRNWRGETVEIDLDVSVIGWSKATADHFLGDRLGPDARQLLRTELNRRVFRPFRSMLGGAGISLNQPGPFSWLEVTSNWNAVCLAGVVGAALAFIEPREERALYVAAAERYIRNFLAGFPADGSCSEGMGYWNYGFGHFVLLAEVVWQATHANLDLLGDERVRRIAQYGARMEIMPGTYPAFADCTPGVTPSTDLMRFVSQRFGLGLSQWEACGPEASHPQFLGIHAFPNSAMQAPAEDATAMPSDVGLRTWFSEAGLYVGRPTSEETSALGVSFKGGCNSEHHNHNDLGSFVVALNGKLMLTDPGSELYTSRTFGPNRYESNVLNSYGHSVPLVDGKLQGTGERAAARILRRSFSDEQDVVVYDLMAAYDVPALKRLQRTFVFSRRGTGSLRVVDEVEFAEPAAFGTALITFGRWQQIASDALLVLDEQDALRVDLHVDGGPFEIAEERIEEDVRVEGHPTRIGISLTAPVEKVTVQVTILSATAGGAC